MDRTKVDIPPQGRSLAPRYECPSCGCEYNMETAQAKGLYCGCTPRLVFMRRVHK